MGAASLTILWIRFAIVRSGSGMSAMLASAAVSPSAFIASALSSFACAFMAARSSAVNPFVVLVAVSLVVLIVASS